MSKPIETALHKAMASVINEHNAIFDNISRKEIIKHVIDNREALVSKNGALATWTEPESTGRSPKDTYIVRRPSSEANIDWTSPNNLQIDEQVFDMVFSDALNFLTKHNKIYITDRVIGADPIYAMPVKTVTTQALTALFTDNMFRPMPKDIKKSIFVDRGFQLLTVPFDKLDSKKYKGQLRLLPNGDGSDIAVIMDMDRRLGVIVGTSYLGSVKKLMFTVMNYYLPLKEYCHCIAQLTKIKMVNRHYYLDYLGQVKLHFLLIQKGHCLETMNMDGVTMVSTILKTDAMPR